MTIPEDVRTAAYTLMQRHLTEPFANDEERRLVLRQADDACEILAAWLDAQPEAPTERWEPVAEMRWLGGLHSFNDIRVIDGMILGVWLSAPGVPPVTANIELPADLRLCRRVEVKP